MHLECGDIIYIMSSLYDKHLVAKFITVVFFSFVLDLSKILNQNIFWKKKIVKLLPNDSHSLRFIKSVLELSYILRLYN